VDLGNDRERGELLSPREKEKGVLLQGGKTRVKSAVISIFKGPWKKKTWNLGPRQGGGGPNKRKWYLAGGGF